MPELVISRPDDWHVHLRDDEMLGVVTPFTSESFRFALVMPNLSTPITTVTQAVAYRERILAAAGPDSLEEFTPLMTLYLNDKVSIDDLRAGHADGVVAAAKYYPAGATTNSEAGASSLKSLYPVLSEMASLGIPLLVHAESTRPEVDIFDREKAFLDDELVDLCRELPDLRVTVEHLSTSSGVDFVLSHDGVAGSITPHHLACDRGDLLANGLRPDLYCKPILNSPEDRRALVGAATSGDPRFFLGTDSAPHPLGDKYCEVARPGIFNSPFAIEVVAEVFHTAGALGQLEAFVSQNGAIHYGLTKCCTKIRIDRRKHPAVLPSQSVSIGESSDVQIFGAEACRQWSVTTFDGSESTEVS